MQQPEAETLDAFVALIGAGVWRERLAHLRSLGARTRGGRALLARHCIEVSIERRRREPAGPATAADARIVALAGEAVRLSRSLPPAGRQRLRSALLATFATQDALIPVFHVLRTATLQRSRGFEVEYAGFADGAPYDLLIRRDGVEAEVACTVISAEEGRGVHRGAWCDLVDRVDPELQTWLAAHPGRYLLKVTLPQGLRGDSEPARGALAALHGRISALLAKSRRVDHDEAAVLRLDPLLLAGAQADELGLMPGLRREFGPEAHLAVVSQGNGVFVLAARGGQADEIATAVRHRLGAVAPVRLTGTRPGILAVFVEEVERREWRLLRERLELEGETRQFLTYPAARRVVAVTCTSRHELFGAAEPDGVADGELRFRNPAHPAAKVAALAPAVLSST
jgi:hypothetical protein